MEVGGVGGQVLRTRVGLAFRVSISKRFVPYHLLLVLLINTSESYL